MTLQYSQKISTVPGNLTVKLRMKFLKKLEQLIVTTNANYLTITPTTPLKSFGNASRV